MICEILSVGTELLLGQIANTDAQFLARRLSMLGITMYRQTTVGDNPARVKEALNTAMSRSDLVITTGGLGPTEDDLTKEMVAEYFGLEMELHQPSLDKIQSYFTGTGRKMTPNNAKQAYFPKGAHIMPNRKGTAPGCVVERDGKRVAVLPGPPFELVDMYEQQLEPYLRSLSDKEIHSRFLRIVGIGESEVETRLLDLFHWEEPTLALYCNPGEVEARITVMCDRGIDPAPMLDPMEMEIRRRLGEAVYAEGLETSMPNEIVKLFRAKGITLSVAESLTGGMLSSQIVDISGASNVLVEAHTTYVNAAKVRVLGVKQETLDKYSEYSHECAKEMAEGVLRMSGSDWAVSTTGVAGPGDDKVKAGTVFIAVAGKGRETKTQELHLRGDRTRVRQLTCLKTLDMLRREVAKAEDTGEAAADETQLQAADRYADALQLLDRYDHHTLVKPKGNDPVYRITYEDCVNMVSQMRDTFDTEVFGVEKEKGKVEGILAAIYQSIFGEEAYPSTEEKAANLLYYMIKDHPYADGCKRIAASLFLEYLNKNNALFNGGQKKLSDAALVAMTLMVAESRPDEKETMVTLLMNLLK